MFGGQRANSSKLLVQIRAPCGKQRKVCLRKLETKTSWPMNHFIISTQVRSEARIPRYVNNLRGLYSGTREFPHHTAARTNIHELGMLRFELCNNFSSRKDSFVGCVKSICGHEQKATFKLISQCRWRWCRDHSLLWNNHLSKLFAYHRWKVWGKWN